MKSDERDRLIERVEALLQEDAAKPSDLRENLSDLYFLYREQQGQVERLIRISDRFQDILHAKQDQVRKLFHQANRRQEKISRISDIYQQIIQESHASLSEAATHDPLTRLPNRRLIHQRLNEERERARRGGPEFCVAMLDIDHFKPINDEHGHEAGDRVLVTVSETIREQMRDYDLCGRWGGEEFLLLLSETTADRGQAIIERILQTVAELRMLVRDTRVRVTISAGLTEHRPPESMEETIHRADQGLYAAKAAGRNCCRIG